MLLCKTREQWLANRQHRIGASDAAAILGVSPWKGALQLFHEKKGTVPPHAGENFARKLGLALEDAIAELYASETQRAVSRPEKGTFQLFTHKTKPYMVATLDGQQNVGPEDKTEFLRNLQTPLEIKTAAIVKAASWTNEPPVDYMVQLQHQLAVTDAPAGTIVALVGGIYIVHSDIERDPEFIALLEGAIDEFQRRLELNDPPPPDGTEATKQFLKHLYPRDDLSKSVTLGPEAEKWDAQIVQAKLDIDDATKRKLEGENFIKVAMQDAPIAVLPSGVAYTWKSVNRAGYTVEPTTYRDFRRKAGKQSRSSKIAKGQAPSIDTIAQQFDADQRAESESDDFDVNF